MSRFDGSPAGQREARRVRHFSPGSILIRLVTPFVAVVGVTVLDQSELLVARMPIVYFWIFSGSS